MEIAEIKDKKRIHEFLLKDPYLHLYELGNLQEKLFRKITWYASSEKGKIRSLSMLYPSEDRSIFFLIENQDTKAAFELASFIAAKLPDRLYCHVSENVIAALEPAYTVSKPVTYIKMKITGDILLDAACKYRDYTYRVNKNDFEPLREFLLSVNPAAFFNRAMLETGRYFCIRKNGEIKAMAGVHFYSEEYGSAAIGNVAVAEKHRGRGLAKSVTASLCRDLWPCVKYIGLNVRADNAAAIKAYTDIGFVDHSRHAEINASLKFKTES